MSDDDGAGAAPAKDFAELVQERLPDLTRTQQAVRLADVAQQTLQNWIAGRNTPRPWLMQRIAQALGVSVGTVAEALEESRRRRVARDRKPGFSRALEQKLM